MRNTIGFALAVSLGFATPAFSQVNTAPPRTTTAPPAVSSPKDVHKTTAAPVPGKNSFTKKQVLKRLKANGYVTVVGLKKDDQSIWHGSAMKDGKQVSFAVDYQGNITAQ